MTKERKKENSILNPNVGENKHGRCFRIANLITLNYDFATAFVKLLHNVRYDLYIVCV